MSQLDSQPWNWSNHGHGHGDDTDDDGLELPVLNNNDKNRRRSSTTSTSSSSESPPAQSEREETTSQSVFEQDQEEEESSDDDDDALEKRNKQWDWSTSEIASISSDELHETRPNRWKGHPTTWRKLTKGDRDAWSSIEGVRMSDLGVHLFNAFALRRDALGEFVRIYEEKRKGSNGKGKRKVKEEDGGGGESVVPRSGQKEKQQQMDDDDEEEKDDADIVDRKEIPWAPPQSWIAWPNYERGYERLGNGELMNGIGERHEGETIRRGRDNLTETLPRHYLEEEISAGILRAVKERFYERRDRDREEDLQEDDDSGNDDGEEEVLESVETDVPGQSPDIIASRGYRREEERNVSRGRSSGDSRSIRKRKRSPSYEPTLLADDELAYEMVRPATIQIMQKLDDTLTQLHNSRVRKMQARLGLHDVEEDNSNGKDATVEPETPKRRGRPRKETAPEYEKPRSVSGRGRPRKIQVPLEGETEEEMLIRIARQQKKRLPEVYFDSKDPESSKSRSRGRSKSMSRRTVDTGDEDEPGTSNGNGRRGQQRSLSRSSRASSVDPSGVPLTRYQQKTFREFPLRNWRDVLGAAALAGFEPDVIARATERCTSLFNLDTTVDRSHEALFTKAQKRTRLPKPVSRRSRSRSRTPGTPRRINASRLVGGFHKCPVADCPMADVGFTRLYSFRRHMQNQHKEMSTSRASSTGPSDKEEDPKPYKCPDPDCPMATTGFPRGYNLRRHIKKMHPGMSVPTVVRIGSTWSMVSSPGASSTGRGKEEEEGDSDDGGETGVNQIEDRNRSEAGSGDEDGRRVKTESETESGDDEDETASE